MEQEERKDSDQLIRLCTMRCALCKSLCCCLISLSGTYPICFHALLLSDKVDVNYIVTSTFLRYIVHSSRLEMINRYLIHIIVLHVTRSYESNIAMQFTSTLSEGSSARQHFAVTGFGPSCPLSGFSLIGICDANEPFIDIFQSAIRYFFIDISIISTYRYIQETTWIPNFNSVCLLVQYVFLELKYTVIGNDISDVMQDYKKNNVDLYI